jgi:hypothetical protein
MRGLAGTGGCPGPQPQAGEPIPVPSRVELVELPEVGIIGRPRIILNPGS